MKKYLASLGVFIFLSVVLSSATAINPPPSADYTGAVTNATNTQKKSQKALTSAYASLNKEIEEGLTHPGVSPSWRNMIQKKLELLRKQGLDAKRVSALKSKIDKLSVGGASDAQVLAAQGAACNASTTPIFTHAFTDLEKVNALNPIGGIGGGSPGRSYIGVKDGMEAPIYAPMDATLRTIVYADRGAGYGEYGLIFEAGCGLQFMFDHIDRISDRLMAYAPKTAAASSQVQDGKRYSIAIRAGELLGYTNGTDLAHTFDFLVMNFAKKNNFLNPKRWEWEQAVYATCQYDYFTTDLRSAYYAKLGRPSEAGIIIQARSCGNPSHDVADTISGGWFKVGSSDIRGEYLAIAREYDGAQVAYRKDGLAFASTENVQAGIPYFRLTDPSPRKFPADVKVGEEICYSDRQNWSFIKLVSTTELALIRGTGACPATFPEEKVETWLR
ncbi:MAG: hypothetical protein WC764_04160 [Candidatus Paceibacterota bacterium]|jgi:hypothetical protein